MSKKRRSFSRRLLRAFLRLLLRKNLPKKMSKALFITMTELKRKSIIDGALDTDKLIQFVEVAQDIHIQNFLGTKLYEKIQSLIKPT